MKTKPRERRLDRERLVLSAALALTLFVALYGALLGLRWPNEEPLNPAFGTAVSIELTDNVQAAESANLAPAPEGEPSTQATTEPTAAGLSAQGAAGATASAGFSGNPFALPPGTLSGGEVVAASAGSLEAGQVLPPGSSSAYQPQSQTSSSSAAPATVTPQAAAQRAPADQTLRGQPLTSQRGVALPSSGSAASGGSEAPQAVASSSSGAAQSIPSLLNPNTAATVSQLYAAGSPAGGAGSGTATGKSPASGSGGAGVAGGRPGGSAAGGSPGQIRWQSGSQQRLVLSQPPSPDLSAYRGRLAPFMTLTISFVVDPSGNVTPLNISPSSAITDLDNLFLEWMRQWRFQPVAGDQSASGSLDVRIATTTG